MSDIINSSASEKEEASNVEEFSDITKNISNVADLNMVDSDVEDSDLNNSEDSEDIEEEHTLADIKEEEDYSNVAEQDTEEEDADFSNIDKEEEVIHVAEDVVTKLDVADMSTTKKFSATEESNSEDIIVITITDHND